MNHARSEVHHFSGRYPDNDLEAVVDGVAAAAALSKDLPILDPGDDMLDASADA